MKLLLIRHGQSSNNVLTAAGYAFEGRSADPLLTDLGRVQAGRLAQAFADGRLPRPQVLLCSPMVRAVQTSVPVSEELDVPVELVTDAYEVGGLYGGMPGAPIAVRGAGASRLREVNPRVVVPSDIGDDGWYDKGEFVEAPAQAQDRGFALFAELERRFRDDSRVIGLICHEWIIQYLLRASMSAAGVCGVPDPWIAMMNTATTYLETDLPAPEPYEGAGETVIHWINRFDHLRSEELSH
ncbi:histidine phosphatase family protein [Propionibacterium australiense]|uniref:Phosphoglycerate mutase family phosphohistidine signature n=1 Tax=Propionibacterium australiense TaxID=119981 RepID=A0A383S6R3_9ACTN|nr:histidine phosphatase family protein [Propionibacterium australiense]RLP08542.1 histidine phosphatase family protein [Propionibacterium australiense]SYZ33607.1 Phosphoglycerate mutase family phosphohistidine signature [Propionibacterium australiense]VEH88800.1 bifunctional RNase H/acid phosphatase [Propionibacterium australiense]